MKPLLHFPALPVGQVTVINSPCTSFFLCQDLCEFPLGMHGEIPGRCLGTAPTWALSLEG